MTISALSVRLRLEGKMDKEKGEIGMEERILENEVTVDDLEESLTGEAEEAQIQEESRETDELIAEIRAGLAELFEDGWTAAEMAAFTQDELVREEVAMGHSVVRAACAYLRRGTAAPRRYSVPTARTTAAGSIKPDNRIEHMTDRQFDAFSRRARAAMMEGRKVRIE